MKITPVLTSWLRRSTAGLLAGCLLLGVMGGSCEEASSTFRQSATDDIASGVKTIIDAVIDGMAEVVSTAGDSTPSEDS